MSNVLTATGNALSVERLQTWLDSKTDTGVVLFGQPGLGQRSLAYQCARDILNTDNVDLSPDFLLVESGGETIGVDVAESIIQKAAFIPVNGRANVCIIDGMEKMTVQAQNRLLKTVEDEANLIIIGIAYDAGILDTIKSRCLCLEFKPLKKEEFLSSYKGNEGELAFMLTRGCPEGVDDEVCDFYKPVIKAVKDRNEKELLKILHLFKEKDTEHFYQVRKAEVPLLLNLLEATYMELLRGGEPVTERLELIQKERSRVGYISYSKNDFYYFITTLI